MCAARPYSILHDQEIGLNTAASRQHQHRVGTTARADPEQRGKLLGWPAGTGSSATGECREIDRPLRRLLVIPGSALERIADLPMWARKSDCFARRIMPESARTG